MHDISFKRTLFLRVQEEGKPYVIHRIGNPAITSPVRYYLNQFCLRELKKRLYPKVGYLDLARKMTSFRSPEKVLCFRVRVRIRARVEVRVSGNMFKYVLGQTFIRESLDPFKTTNKLYIHKKAHNVTHKMMFWLP